MAMLFINTPEFHYEQGWQYRALFTYAIQPQALSYTNFT
ncbi:hypothetical protein PRUB_a4032 [Pseudoalteromonas rubra]|uniref:Uncharacterized protein n=1 Tax=Pseudoalteromonas rubra TaxID=43658 RepID=A0A8T0CAR4_9GAMM|nr:hypothetical protein PRUB_a4032 [Pseudoalteromonas rubra]